MKAALRMALAYFSIVPLQRWLNLAALLLFVAAVITGSRAGSLAARSMAMGMTIFATLLAVMVPALMGGVAMRMASTRTLLHLRPHGRMTMVVAATLVITALAALCVLPGEFGAWLRVPGARPAGAPLLPVFQVCWAVLALAWISIFAFSFSRYAFGLIGMIPVVTMGLGSRLMPVIPSATWVMAFGLVAWVLFGRWYQRVDSLSRPVSLMTGATWDGRDYSWLNWLVDRFRSDGAVSRKEAEFVFLVGGRPMVHVLVGLWVAFIFLAVHLLTGLGRHRPPSGQMLYMLPFVAFYPVTLCYNLTCRSRLLWLRTGLDRPALFRLTESLGLRALLWSWSIVAVVTGLVAVFLDGYPPRFVLEFMAPQMGLAACLAYVGLALVRDWSFGDVLLAIGGMVMFIAATVASVPTLRSANSIAPTVMLPVTLVFLVLLRSLAAQRWRTLDWRLARLPQAGARSEK